MTSEDKQRFESQWPAVAARLERLLVRRGVPPGRRDDLVQETGLRLLGSWTKVDAARPLWPFVVTIALNLMRDEARRASVGVEVPSELPESSDGTDVEHAGLARLELRRAGLAMALLKPGHRAVLLAQLDPEADLQNGSKAATKMLRLRARKRLAALMQQVSALGVAALGPLKRVARSGHLIPYRGALEGVAPALCGALCAFVAMGGLSLAPFSSLPRTDGNLVEQGGMTLSSGGTSASDAGERTTLGRSGGTAGRGFVTATAPGSGVHSSEDGEQETSKGRGPISHESQYEIPLGGDSLANGSLTIEVHHGEEERLPDVPDPNGSIDCSEQMVTPNEIDVRCWQSNDPQNKYGVRIEHDGENFTDAD